MSKVWFSSLKDITNQSEIPERVLNLHRAAEFQRTLVKKGYTAVKIHFGEKNNTGYIKPEWIKSLLQEVNESGCKTFLTDTNTLYYGKRFNSVDHLLQAHKHGFSIDNLGVPIIIADGLISKNYSEVPIPGEHFKSVKIVNDILHSNSLIVLSHMTGHVLSGLGAAIKNLAMGCAPRSGKQMQHADIKPRVTIENCQACGLCMKYCLKEAISFYDGVAWIDEEKCYGCGECIATCRFKAIEHSMSDASEPLQEKMAEYALGAVQDKKGKVCYFNFLTHITKECDCIGKAQHKITEDIGILASYDPVAIDQASIDLLKKQTGEDTLLDLWPHNDYNVQLSHGEKIGLGSRKYELIAIE